MNSDDRRREAVTLDFAAEKSFALLMILTVDGKTLIRPIGGDWANGINEAIEVAKESFPGCKMKIYEENYGAWKKYFMPNGVLKDNVLI